MIIRARESSRRLFWAVGSLGMLLSACSWVPKGESQLDVGIEDRGVASWYVQSFHGKQTANGELFNMEALTAAHRTLPLGSVVRVVNLANGKHLHVRITDRGPYVYSRILDRLCRRGWRDLDRPVRLSKLTKLWIGLRYGLL